MVHVVHDEDIRGTNFSEITNRVIGETNFWLLRFGRITNQECRLVRFGMYGKMME